MAETKKPKVWTNEEIAKNVADQAMKELPVELTQTLSYMDSMRKALNTMSKEEIEKLVEKLMWEHNVWNKVELKQGDKPVVILKDQPRHFLFSKILTAVDTGIPTALIGPAGSGKSSVCMQVADALNLKYYLQNAVTGTHELSGYMDAHGKYNSTAFRASFERGGLILVDEVDTSDASALKWINTALANGYAMFPDKEEPVYAHKDFRIVIAANTFGNGADRIYVGANQLDASTLDRFVFFDFGYDEKLELTLSGNIKWVKRVQALRKSATKEKARMVISPRASINGTKLLKAGWTEKECEDALIWKGLDPELKERIVQGAK